MSESPPNSEEIEVNRVTVVTERMRRGEPLAFVDSRSESSWNEADAQVPGSIRVPPDQAAQFISKVAKDRSVITYCT